MLPCQMGDLLVYVAPLLQIISKTIFLKQNYCNSLGAHITLRLEAWVLGVGKHRRKWPTMHTAIILID